MDLKSRAKKITYQKQSMDSIHWYQHISVIFKEWNKQFLMFYGTKKDIK